MKKHPEPTTLFTVCCPTEGALTSVDVPMNWCTEFSSWQDDFRGLLRTGTKLKIHEN